jgi:hypothetical protein
VICVPLFCSLRRGKRRASDQESATRPSYTPHRILQQSHQMRVQWAQLVPLASIKKPLCSTVLCIASTPALPCLNSQPSSMCIQSSLSKKRVHLPSLGATHFSLRIQASHTVAHQCIQHSTLDERRDDPVCRYFCPTKWFLCQRLLLNMNCPCCSSPCSDT